MLKKHAERILPLVSNPCAPYGAQGLDSSIIIWHGHQRQPMTRFLNAFKTPISVVDWSLDGSILLAGSITGEVLAWRFTTGELLLANRHAHSYAPICRLSWSPGGCYLVAITCERTMQIWLVETRECLAVLPCSCRPTSLKWSLDGSGFITNNGVAWTDLALEGGRA
jgi:WD40 repeat protein